MRSQDQVQLSTLLFGVSWEDPESDKKALAIAPGDTVFTITSGGCNTLTFLLEDPAKIFANDINPSQSYLLELKCAAVRRLEYDQLHSFLGLKPSGNRLKVFEQLRGELTPEAASYWTVHSGAVRDGIIHAGRYESFIRLFGRLLKVLQGRKRMEGLFQSKTLQQQQAYFNKRWNTPQWRLLFKVLINKRMLAKRGLTADYFKFDDGSSSFAESFFRRTAHAMRDIPIASNYFLAQYILGRYLDEEAVPSYLLKENLPIVRERLDRLQIVTSDAQSWLKQQPQGQIDCFSLSNICELMSTEETERLFNEVLRSARDGARICFRNLIIPREVPNALQQNIELQPDLSRDLLASDRSFVYSRVQAFLIRRNVRAATDESSEHVNRVSANYV